MWCRCELGPEQLTLAFTSPFCSVSFQEAQVTIECTIPQKFHRSIMGPKGSKIQQITRDYNVQIKFPDREENPGHSMEPPVHENGEDASDGREGKEAEPGSPRRCDIIIISGRKEKCEAAKEALEALVPITIEVEVPYDLHRYIIGQKGSGIRKMMDEFEVKPLGRSSPRMPGAGKGAPCSCTLRELSCFPPPSSSRS